MAKKTIGNCNVIREAVAEGKGKPLKEELNGQIYCQGYQVSENDDEPYNKCKHCRLNIFKYA